MSESCSPKKKCVFCDIVNGTHHRPESILVETDNFIVLPNAMPAHGGHSLIVPKKHSLSMASFCTSLELYNEMQGMIDITRDMVADIMRPDGWDFDVCIMESGTGKKSQLTAGCIEHAHLHVGNMRRDVENRVMQECNWQQLPHGEWDHSGDYDGGQTSWQEFHKFADESYIYLEQMWSERYITTDIPERQYVRNRMQDKNSDYQIPDPRKKWQNRMVLEPEIIAEWEDEYQKMVHQAIAYFARNPDIRKDMESLNWFYIKKASSTRSDERL
ncbi:MAG: hypothetical protein FWE16_06115 [Firmicutes bacterium]|nr:hypothetical protein [Bacillota bacterium]